MNTKIITFVLVFFCIGVRLPAMGHVSVIKSSSFSRLTPTDVVLFLDALATLDILNPETGDDHANATLQCKVIIDQQQYGLADFFTHCSNDGLLIYNQESVLWALVKSLENRRIHADHDEERFLFQPHPYLDIVVHFDGGMRAEEPRCDIKALLAACKRKIMKISLFLAESVCGRRHKDVGHD